MTLTIRTAREFDLPALISLLQQLSLDEPREDPSALELYRAAFTEIQSDSRQTVLVAEDESRVVGTATLIIVANLSHVGRPYAVVEDVVVDDAARGQRHGEALIRHAIELARNARCYKLVLTSNLARTSAHRFYERLGFSASHLGFRIDF